MLGLRTTAAAALALACVTQANAAPTCAPAAAPACTGAAYLCQPVQAVQCAPAAKPAPKPAPKPCGIDLQAAVKDLPIPEHARALIQQSTAVRARSARFTIAGGGRVIMDTGQELTGLRLPHGQDVSPLLGRSGDVYRAAGYYVLRYDGCLPLVMATNAADSLRIDAPPPPVGGGMRLPQFGQGMPTARAVAAVPEPSTFWLVLSALAAVVFIFASGRR
jgi:hypothetical protein